MGKFTLSILLTGLLFCSNADGFEHLKRYYIQSTTSALTFDLGNGGAGANTPVKSLTQQNGNSAQQWLADRSSSWPGTFYLKGLQSGSLRVLELTGTSLYHLVYRGDNKQVWYYDKICTSGSGLIRSYYTGQCLKDNGNGATLTVATCDQTNPSMLWQLIPI